MYIEDVDTPTVWIDLDRMERNIADMADYMDAHNVDLRPHCKTHKIPQIAKMQLDAGAVGVTLAKLGEAEVFAHHGIEDIFIANEIIGAQKIRRLLALHRRATIRSGVDTAAGAQALSDAAVHDGTTLDVLVEVDSGIHRAGIAPEEAPTLVRQVVEMPGLVFRGLFTYHPLTVSYPSEDEWAAWGRREAETITQLADVLREDGIEVETLSAGGTPLSRKVAEVPGITETRPGQYVFYCMHNVYHGPGVCTLDDVALFVRARVTSRQGEERAVLDAGSKMLTSDIASFEEAQAQGYGYIVGYPDARIVALSEEHAHVRLGPESRSLDVGDIVDVIPNHVCPVVNLQDELVGIRDGKVEVVWPVSARGKSK